VGRHSDILCLMILHSSSYFRPGGVNHTPVIQVTAIYEDLEAGLRAKALMDCVQSGLDVPARLKLDLWRFDWLNELSIRNMALNIAKSSTLVVVSASTNKPFPVEMERWMRAWTQGREDQLSAIVLIALEHGHSAGCHPLQASLQRVAQQKRVEFYCEFFKPSHVEHAAAATYRGGYEDLFRPRYERQSILPPIVGGARSNQLVGLTGNAFH
jgi:hypothetical protein